jgi:hypothetical protein
MAGYQKCQNGIYYSSDDTAKIAEEVNYYGRQEALGTRPNMAGQKTKKESKANYDYGGCHIGPGEGHNDMHGAEHQGTDQSWEIYRSEWNFDIFVIVRCEIPLY